MVTLKISPEGIRFLQKKDLKTRAVSLLIFVTIVTGIYFLKTGHSKIGINVVLGYQIFQTILQFFSYRSLLRTYELKCTDTSITQSVKNSKDIVIPFSEITSVEDKEEEWWVIGAGGKTIKIPVYLDGFEQVVVRLPEVLPVATPATGFNKRNIPHFLFMIVLLLFWVIFSLYGLKGMEHLNIWAYLVILVAVSTLIVLMVIGDKTLGKREKFGLVLLVAPFILWVYIAFFHK